MKGFAPSGHVSVVGNAAVFSNRLARTEDRPQSAGRDSHAPAPLDYAARRSPWSWLSQLTIWFQLVKIWVTIFSSALSDGAKYLKSGRGLLTPPSPSRAAAAGEERRPEGSPGIPRTRAQDVESSSVRRTGRTRPGAGALLLLVLDRSSRERQPPRKVAAPLAASAVHYRKQQPKGREGGLFSAAERLPRSRV